MATIWEKQGLLGLGQSKRKDLCDRCGEDVTSEEKFFNPDPPTSEFFCRSCALAMNINLKPHNWPTDKTLFGNPASFCQHWMKDTSDGKEKFIKQCFRCSSLLVGRKVGENFERSFYEVGSSSSKTVEPDCIERVGEFLRGHPKDQLRCRHIFIEVATSRVSDAEGEKLLNTLKDSSATSIFGMIDHDAAAFGRRYIWCRNCGLFYDLPRYKEKDLKKIGINEDWYL